MKIFLWLEAFGVSFSCFYISSISSAIGGLTYVGVRWYDNNIVTEDKLIVSQCIFNDTIELVDGDVRG
ncbi:MAG: hypothetical protein K2L61_04500 [Clostridia bacterium]|nr:hypothetical protein [Clostridia bacterium]